MRTYLYKLTSDRGGAPCAPPNADGSALLTLSICKPAIRRTAQPGDRLVGITSRALEQREGYPPHAVIYAAVVTRCMDAYDYYNPAGAFAGRPDCIYGIDPGTGRLEHTGRTRLHAEPAYAARDVGRFPHYRNARTLLCEDFRYFGANAVPIPARLHNLLATAEALGQGHRVFEAESPMQREVDALFRALWKRPTGFTPERVEEEAPGHAPR